jgi:hypothetical protein
MVGKELSADLSQVDSFRADLNYYNVYERKQLS